MSDPDRPRSGIPTRLVAVLAVVALVAGGLVAFRDWLPLRRAPAGAPAPEAALVPEEGDESTIERALRLARVDSTKKEAWVEEVPGIDLAAFSAPQRELFVRFANAERCSCGCGFTLAACRQYDSSCEISGPRVERLRDSVLAGAIRSANGLRERPEGGEPGR